MSRFIQHTLKNGLRVCLEPLSHVPSAACGFMVCTGARDERPEEAGISHFLEHMSFKGTARATWMDINQEFDRLGSQYNAFTSHEITMYYGWVPSQNLAAQTALLADMMRSILPEEEFETEKQVILEEIAQYRDSLQSCLFELAEKHLFAGSSLGHSVLGDESTVGPMTRAQMAAYHQRRYGPDNLVYVASGQIDPDAILKQLETLTESWQPGQGGRQQTAPKLRPGRAIEQTDKFNRQAILLAYPGPSNCDVDPRTSVVQGVLSGENSRIFWEIIQRGLCPQAGAFYLSYEDVSAFVLYALCEPDRLDTVVSALKAQADKLQQDGPLTSELERVKNAVRTELAVEGDSPMSRLLQISDDIHLERRPVTLDEHLSRIESVTIDGIRDLLQQYPITGEPTLVSVGPRASI